jgi:hypothetical protein
MDTGKQVTLLPNSQPCPITEEKETSLPVTALRQTEEPTEAKKGKLCQQRNKT